MTVPDTRPDLGEVIAGEVVDEAGDTVQVQVFMDGIWLAFLCADHPELDANVEMTRNQARVLMDALSRALTMTQPKEMRS